MTQTQHTPGPWKAVRSNFIPGAWDIWSNGHPQFATVVGAEYAMENGQENNAEANARLIAAAPDLLAVLEGLVAAFDGETDCTDILDMIGATDSPARAAIAAAKGGAA